MTCASNESGFVQTWALLLVIVAGSAANLAAGRVDRLRDARLQERASVVALYAAEAGVEKARVLVHEGTQIGSWQIRVADAEVTVDIEPSDRGRFRVSSRARVWPRGRNGLAHVTTVRVQLDARRGFPRTSDRYETRPN